MILFNDNNMESLKHLQDNSVDSVITDPPYGLSFMNKKWDYEVPSEEFWREVYRVLKPGGHILSFGGTRTYHRMVVNIEDAGFEIRDQIQWIYSTGFPKSLNIKKQIEKKEYEKCDCSKQKTQYNLRQLPETDISQEINSGKKHREALFQELSQQNTQISEHTTGDVWREKPCLEGGNNTLQEKGKLQGDYLQESTYISKTDGEERWVYNGAQDDNGRNDRQITNKDGSSPSHRPRPLEQQSEKSGTLAEQLITQKSGVGQVCSKCEKPFIEWEGFGTALKPANEPICLARKPLSEKSISENVLRWGTGGLNIDGCRVGFEDTPNPATNPKYRKENGYKLPKRGQVSNGAVDFTSSKNEINTEGRFPANVILECICDEVIQGEKGKIQRSNGRDRSKHQYNSVGNLGSYDGTGTIDNYNDKGDIHTNPDCPCYIMDEQSGVSKSRPTPNHIRKGNVVADNRTPKAAGIFGDGNMLYGSNHNDKGGSSRFFYRAKVSKKERNLGLDEGEKSTHPTVKPINLLTYLCRLITPPNGVVLDPFMGSGSTGVAALLEGFDFIGMELDKDYYEIAQKRIENYKQYESILKNK